MVNIEISCGRCGYKGEGIYSFPLCGIVCPRCRAIILPDLIREITYWRPRYEQKGKGSS